MAHLQIVSQQLLLFDIICIFILLVYTITILLIWYGWITIHSQVVNSSSITLSVSVVIAARNEDFSLSLLLSDLLKQTYPVSLVEILVVDDHSEKKISQLSLIISQNHPNIQIIELPAEKQGKKQAIAEGVKHSKNELILFTDADCRVSPNWIRQYVDKYLLERPGIIIGLVDYPIQKGWFPIFSRFDFISLIVTGAGAAELDRPVMCNGANMAVRRDLYFELSDQLKHNVFSGDDVFLLHAVKKTRIEKISVLKTRGSIVTTQAPVDIKEFVNQHIRWASKSRYYSDRDTIALALIIFVSNLAIIITIISLTIKDNYFVLALLLIIKTTADCFVLATGLKFFGGLRDLFWLPVFELIYPIYFVCTAISSLLISTSWKGRKISNLSTQ
jgi:cellulose synthase/poly-beta-1,6-N-acetylglucosamine synthase-like glycosyltransferase